jgi:uncharacterized protein
MMLIRAAITLSIVSVASAFASTPEVPSTSHIEAAEELVRAIGADNAKAAGLEMLRATIRQNPDLAPYEGVIQGWFAKIADSEEFKAQSRDVYVRHFTEGELRQLSEFYKTEVGKKLARSLPEIAKESAEASAKFIQDNLSDLQAKLAEARDNASKEKKP